MPRYRVHYVASTLECYIVEARDIDEAQEKYENGDYEHDYSETYDGQLDYIEEIGTLRREEPNNIEYHLPEQQT